MTRMTLHNEVRGATLAFRRFGKNGEVTESLLPVRRVGSEAVQGAAAASANLDHVNAELARLATQQPEGELGPAPKPPTGPDQRV